MTRHFYEFLSRIKLHLSSVKVTTKGRSYSSLAEPGEGQFSSVHAKCPESLPGERADKVFSL